MKKATVFLLLALLTAGGSFASEEASAPLVDPFEIQPTWTDDLFQQTQLELTLQNESGWEYLDWLNTKAAPKEEDGVLKKGFGVFSDAVSGVVKTTIAAPRTLLETLTRPLAKREKEVTETKGPASKEGSRHLDGSEVVFSPVLELPAKSSDISLFEVEQGKQFRAQKTVEDVANSEQPREKKKWGSKWLKIMILHQDFGSSEDR